MKGMIIWTLCALGLFISGCQSFGGPRDAFNEGQKAQARGDYTTAMRQFRTLAVKGDPIAQYIVGEMYEQGQGVAPDLAEAGKWYRMSFTNEKRGARLMAENKLNEPAIRDALNRPGAASRPALEYADDRGGLQCPENMEHFHSKLHHQEAHGVAVMVGPNGGFSTNIPEHIKKFGLEDTIQVQMDALRADREAVKGNIGRERREILEDTINAKEELLNVLWCYQQPGAEVAKAPSRRFEITEVRSSTENKLDGTPVEVSQNRYGTEPRSDLVFANARGGLQCPETMEYFHSKLRHQGTFGVEMWLMNGNRVSSNGGFSTNIPASIKENGLEQTIKWQKDGIRDLRQQFTRDMGCEQREILEDTINAKEELLNVLWCYQQPGAEIAKAPSQMAEIGRLRDINYFCRNPVDLSDACRQFRSNPPATPASSCPRVAAAPVRAPEVSSPRKSPGVIATDSRPISNSDSSPSRRTSRPRSGNTCIDAMGSVLTGEMLTINKNPTSIGGYLANALWFPLGLLTSASVLVTTPLAMVFAPSACHDTSSTGRSTYSGSSSTYTGSSYKGCDFESSWGSGSGRRQGVCANDSR